MPLHGMYVQCPALSDGKSDAFYKNIDSVDVVDTQFSKENTSPCFFLANTKTQSQKFISK